MTFQVEAVFGHVFSENPNEIGAGTAGPSRCDKLLVYIDI